MSISKSSLVNLLRMFCLTALLLTSATTRAATPPPPEKAEAESAVYIFRVTVNSPNDVARLTNGGWDVLEARGPDYLLVLGDSKTADRLRAESFTVVIDHRVTTPGGIDPFTFYGGYRTVVEHYQHLTDTVTAHPDLAVVLDYGDSYRKQQAVGGYDLQVICLTKLQPGDCALSPTSTKPRFFLMAAIHARELSTSEMTWRWIDYLVNNYNVDPDVTMLLDYNELWVVPVVNPDGREVVESGGNNPILQRKNLHNYGGCTGTSIGVDLNRNANFQWGGSGSSGVPCAETYRGPTPASEPEEFYLEALMSNLFADQRGPVLTDTAPLTTTGAMLTLHTYSNLVLFPWGWVECFGSACPPSMQAPNNTGLRSWGFRLSYYNNYTTGQPSEVLYAADGTTDDWAYGALGIAAGTFEIGPQSGTCGGFLPPYTCQDSTFWPLNRPAFIYAAKVARQPYALVLGPTTFTPTVSLTQTLAGVPVTVTATTNDNAYGNASGSVGRPTAQTIAAGEVYVDTPPWASGTPISLTAQDGTFNSTTEVLTTVLDTSALSLGRHVLFVRGQDAAGNWGPVTAQWLWISAPNSAPTLSDTSDQNTPEDVPLGPLTVTVGDVDNQPLTLTAISSDQALIPNANIALGGANLTRTVTLTPAANLVGSAIISLTVSDGYSTTTDTFLFTVTPVNDPPTISDVGNHSTPQDTPTAPIPFTINDVDVGDTLTVTATSADQNLVLDANIVISGTGSARTVIITPVAGMTGNVLITLTVTDGLTFATDTFILNVTAQTWLYLPVVRR